VAARLVSGLDSPPLKHNLVLTAQQPRIAQSSVAVVTVMRPALRLARLAPMLFGIPGCLLPLAALAAPEPIRIGGSSTVFPIMQAAIAAYQKGGAHRQVRFELKETGTSAGFRQFCSGQLPLANASRPINAKELKACAAKGVTFLELPIGFDAITVVVNPRNTWASSITTRELARLWSAPAAGSIKTWSQVNLDWPNRPIRLCGPGKDSGTYDYFNKAINGDEDNSRSDYFASEKDGELVACVAKNPDALGYFGFAYYQANAKRLKPLSVVGKKGAALPSLASVQKETYVPLSRPLFVYVNDRALRQRPELQKFVTYAIQNGLNLVKQAGYIPMPSSTYMLVESKLYRHVSGTAFAGDLPVGLTTGQALQRSLESIKKPAFR
jgi:phosphate transport system substrate-binding protein